MKRVKFKCTAAGTYGVAQTGDVFVVNNSLARELEERGTVEILSEAPEGAEEDVKGKGSVRFSDETLKEKVNITEKVSAPEKEGKEEKAKEKNDKAGPNKKK